MQNVNSKLIVANGNDFYVEITEIGEESNSVIVSQVAEAEKIIEDLQNFIELSQ